jgi:hypothetical protein
MSEDRDAQEDPTFFVMDRDRAMLFLAALLLLALNVALTTTGVLLAFVGGRALGILYLGLLVLAVGLIAGSALARTSHLRRCAREGSAPDAQTFLWRRRRIDSSPR